MIQEVNLYQATLNTNKTRPVVNNYIYGLLLPLFLLIGSSAYLLFDQNNTSESIKKAQQQLSDAEIEVEQLRIHYPPRQTDSLITEEITRLQNILTSLSQVVYLLSENDSDQTQGFSRYFSALARQNIPDVWLTDIAIDAENNLISLQGSTFNTEKLPVFLQKLHQEPIFKGRTFEKLTISQAKEKSQQLDFHVSTTIKTPEKVNENE